jgi:hypothetical protein
MTDRSATTHHPQLVRAALSARDPHRSRRTHRCRSTGGGRRRLNEAYRLELDTKSGGVGRWPINPSNSSRPANSSRLW